MTRTPAERPHRRLSRALGLVAVLLTLMLPLAACGSSKNEGSKGSHNLTIALGLAVTGVDPHLSGNVLDGNVLVNMYDGLFDINTEGQVVPALATAMEPSADGLTYQVTLRKGVTFQNGDPFTADDVKFSMERVLNPKTAAPYGGDLQNIAKVIKTGDYSLTLKMKSRDPLLPNRLAGAAGMVIPKSYFEEVGAAGFAKHPIGTGPYKFVSEVPSQQIVLEAFKGYWGNDKPKLDKITFKMVPEAATRLALLQSGEVDMANNLDTSVAQTLSGSKNLKATGVSSGSVLFLQASQTDPRFKNPKVVKALNYAINREAIVKSVLNGFGELIGGVMPPDLPGFSEAVIPPYPYDPAEAKKLLAESGEDFSQPIPFEVPSGRWANASESAQVIVSDLAKVGVKLKLQMMDYSAWLKKNEDHTISPVFPDNLSARVRDMIPGLAGSFGCGELYSFSCDPQFDRMVKAANLLTGEQRVKATEGLMQRLHDHPRVVFLWSLQSVFGINSRVHWEPASATEVINLRDASVS